jgi:hypothetical protein
MNNDYGGNRRLLRAGLLPAMAAVAVLTAACGGSASSSSSAGGSANYQMALAYSQCMRARGVADFPDPDAQGNIVQHVSGNPPADQSGSLFQAADTACRHLLPGGGGRSTAAQQQVISRWLQIAQCMRAHGVPNYPDPQVSGGRIVTGLSAAGVNVNSPQFQAAEHACKSVIPPGFSPGGDVAPL